MRRLLLSVGLCLALSTSAWAQLASQTGLVGTVRDSSGGVLPGASVTAVNVGTQDTYETVTNEEGLYNIPNVRTGRYTITVALEGFKTFQATGVDVAGNQVVRRDAVLDVGALSETVTVEAAAAVLATDRASVSQTIEARAVSELPVAGRNVWALAATAPGVQEGSKSDIGYSFRGAGQRNIQNNMTLDGISSMSNLLAMSSILPIQDAVEEVQVQTGSTSAEYGSFLGVHVNVVTKGGTNQFKGSVYEYYQDDALNSRGYFENRSLPKNPLSKDQFGAVFSGPVTIPRLYDGRNRTFFMGAYEGIRQELVTSPIVSVPTERMRRGDFSEISTQIRDPFTRLPFPGNQIPQSRLDATALQLLQYYPAANLAGTASNFQGSAPDKDNFDQALLRFDQNVGNSIRLSFRYNYLKADETYAPASIEINQAYQPRTNYNWLVSYTHTLKANLHNDFRIGYHNLDFETVNYFYQEGIQGAGAALGIPGFDGDVRYSNPGLPVMSISAFSALAPSGTNWFQFDKTFQLSDVISYTRGKHTLRAGFDMKRLETGRAAQNSARGQFTFNGDMTGYAMADFMLGLPRSVITPADQLWGQVGGWRNGFFVNDVWQVNDKTTLSLGLRYELNTPVQTYSGFASMLDPSGTKIIPSAVLAEYPFPGFEFHDPNNTDFGPRLGATYRLSDKTIVRGGWGIYYNPNQMNSFTFLTNNPPLAAQITYSSDPNNPTLSFKNPTGVVGPAGPPNIITPNRDLPNSYKNQWSVDIQQELWPSTVLDIQYLASRTRDLDRSFYPNTPQPGAGAIDPRRPNPLFREIRTIQNDVIANYDSLAFVLRRRMTKGLAFNTHYTWSKNRDMTEHSNGGGRTVDNFDIWRDYGPAAWDIPHRFVISGIYELPFFKDSANVFLREVVGGWQVSGVATFQSGTPLNVTIQGDRLNNTSPNQRPDLVGSIPKLTCEDNPSGPGLVNCIDASAFALPALYTYGNLSRNALRGLSYSRTDLSLMKSFTLGGRARAMVHVQFFNLFNEVNWGAPNTQVGAANFGRVTSAQDMRTMELGIKFQF